MIIVKNEEGFYDILTEPQTNEDKKLIIMLVTNTNKKFQMIKHLKKK